MHVLLDHLGAAIAAGVILTVVIAMQFNQGEATRTEALYRSQRARAQAFALVLEDDLRNLGSGLAPSDTAITAWDDSTFSFLVRDDFGSAATRTVTYRRRSVGADAAGTPLFEVDRLADGGPPATGPAPLLGFEMTLLDAAGAAVTDPADAAAVRVWFSAGRTDVGTGEVHPLTRLSRTIYPPSLAP